MELFTHLRLTSAFRKGEISTLPCSVVKVALPYLLLSLNCNILKKVILFPRKIDFPSSRLQIFSRLHSCKCPLSRPTEIVQILAEAMRLKKKRCHFHHIVKVISYPFPREIDFARSRLQIYSRLHGCKCPLPMPK